MGARIVRFFLRLSVFLAIFAAVLVMIQDFMILPSLAGSLIANRDGIPPTQTPDGVRSFFLEAPDKTKIEIWELESTSASKQAAIVFHGNAGTVDTFFFVQRWLKQLGITSYGFEYRGIGRSSGWPSEKGFYSDTDRLIEYLGEEKGYHPESLILVGISLGTGLATYAAEKYPVNSLVLFSPFSSLTQIVREGPYRPLLPFVKYKFPNVERFKNLKAHCLIMAHGKKDNTIPFSHFETLAQVDQGERQVYLFASENADHGYLFSLTADAVGAAIQNCMASAES